MDERETKPFASDAERTKKTEAFEQLAARIDAATDAIEMLRIADAIQEAFGSAGLGVAEVATYRLRLLVERLDRRMQATLSQADPEMCDPQVAASAERYFWDEAAIRIASAFTAAGRTDPKLIAREAAVAADKLLAERRARRAPSSAP